jgi:hypothetical protein
MSYYKDRLESNKCNMKNIWNILKQAMDKSMINQTFHNHLKLDQESISESFN